MPTATDKAKDQIEGVKKQAEDVQKLKEELEKQAKEKQGELQKEKDKPRDEQDQGKIEGLTTDIIGISDRLKQLREALEALAEALKELQPVLEQLVKLGESVAETVLKLLKEVLDFITQLIKSITDLLKELLKLIKVLLIIPLLLQKIFDISIMGSVTVQPLMDQPVTALTSITERDATMLHDRAIRTLGELAAANLVALQRCGINVEHVSMLQEQAKVAVRPFGREFLFLIEELDLNLVEVARRAEADFLQPKERIRAIRADILSRGAVLRLGILDKLRVTDIIDISVPVGFAQDCLPSTALDLSRLRS